MEGELLAYAAKWGVGGGLTFYAISLLIKQAFGTRTDAAESGARVGMLDALQDRLARVEAKQAETETALDAERAQRRDAENKVATLTIRVASLESQIRALGGVPA